MAVSESGRGVRVLRRALIGITTASAAVFGSLLILAAVTLGRCDAFGGRCPANEPSLFDDDVFGMAALGAFLIVAVPSFLYRPSPRRLLMALPLGAVVGLIVGLIARSSVP
jgi:hypothetical protein